MLLAVPATKQRSTILNMMDRIIRKLRTTKLNFIPPGLHPINIKPAAKCGARFKSVLMRNPEWHHLKFVSNLHNHIVVFLWVYNMHINFLAQIPRVEVLWTKVPNTGVVKRYQNGCPSTRKDLQTG